MSVVSGRRSSNPKVEFIQDFQKKFEDLLKEAWKSGELKKAWPLLNKFVTAWFDDKIDKNSVFEFLELLLETLSVEQLQRLGSAVDCLRNFNDVDRRNCLEAVIYALMSTIVRIDLVLDNVEYDSLISIHGEARGSNIVEISLRTRFETPYVYVRKLKPAGRVVVAFSVPLYDLVQHLPRPELIRSVKVDEWCPLLIAPLNQGNDEEQMKALQRLADYKKDDLAQAREEVALARDWLRRLGFTDRCVEELLVGAEQIMIHDPLIDIVEKRIRLLSEDDLANSVTGKMKAGLERYLEWEDRSQSAVDWAAKYVRAAYITAAYTCLPEPATLREDQAVMSGQTKANRRVPVAQMGIRSQGNLPSTAAVWETLGLSSGEDEVFWFHGTSYNHADKILGNGINIHRGRPLLDFGRSPSFYVMDNFDAAAEWAKQHSVPSVIIFKVSWEELKSLNPHLIFDRADERWATLVTQSRNEDLTDDDCDEIVHEADRSQWIYGPVLRYKSLQRGYPEPISAWRQLGLKKDEAARLFDRNVAGVVCFAESPTMR